MGSAWGPGRGGVSLGMEGEWDRVSYQPGVSGMGEVSLESQRWIEPAWGPRDGAESGCHKRQRTV